MPDETADPAARAADEPRRLVCGLCEEVLGETYPDPAEADCAADAHARDHADERSVVVLAVPATVLDGLDGGADEALAIAVAAQQRVSRRPDT